MPDPIIGGAFDPSKRCEKRVFLPEAKNGAASESAVPPQDSAPAGKFPCPCCGSKTYPVPPEEDLAYICPVCFWENDRFIVSDDEPSDQNHGMSLNEARKNYAALGAVRADFLQYVRKPTSAELSTDSSADVGEP